MNSKPKHSQTAKEWIETKFPIRRKPAFEQPVLQLPLPPSFPENYREEKRDEKTERGIYTFDI